MVQSAVMESSIILFRGKRVKNLAYSLELLTRIKTLCNNQRPPTCNGTLWSWSTL